MATELRINGNFLVIYDNATYTEYIRNIAAETTYQRRDDDKLAFFYKIPSPNNDQFSDEYILGTNYRSFLFSDVIDYDTGLVFPSADAFDDKMAEALGDAAGTAANGYLTYVATDATLSGDGTVGSPLSVVPDADTYTERWDLLASLIPAAWHTIPTGAPAGSIISIVIDSNINNNNVGIRAVGSGLSRILTIDKDSTAYFLTKVDASGDIEIYTLNTNVIIYVESYL